MGQQPLIHSVRSLFLMSLCQIFVISCVILFFESMSLLAHATGIFVVSVACFCFLGRDSDSWPHRTDIWALSRKIFGVMWLVSGVGYCVWFLHSPHLFDFSFSRLFVIAPLVALAPAFLSLILTLCAGDTALLILGREEKESQ